MYNVIFVPNIYAEEFSISALEFSVDKKNNILIGEGSVEAIDSEGKIIKAGKITYEKSNEFLLAERSVEVIDIEGNIKDFNVDSALKEIKEYTRFVRILGTYYSDKFRK